VTRRTSGAVLLAAAAALRARLRAAPPAPQPESVPRPKPMDLCPVCGMLVSKYPNWTATVVWRDRGAAHFDGCKDMFKYLRNLKKYAAARKPEDISAISVTDFYDLKKVDGRKAYYVIGSDVLGPMGHELVPLATAADAAEFLKEHKGVRILRFDQVTAETLDRVDQGKF
jgi:copper chaperone NosL